MPELHTTYWGRQTSVPAALRLNHKASRQGREERQDQPENHTSRMNPVLLPAAILMLHSLCFWRLAENSPPLRS
jgi:hypothetical protein